MALDRLEQPPVQQAKKEATCCVRGVQLGDGLLVQVHGHGACDRSTRCVPSDLKDSRRRQGPRLQVLWPGGF